MRRVRYKNTSPPITPIENDEIRLFPNSYEKGDFWAIPLDWLLSLRFKKDDFTKNEFGVFCVNRTYLGFNYLFYLQSIEFKRVFGLVRNYERGKSTCSVRIKNISSNVLVDDYLTLDLYGKSYSENELKRKYQELLSTLKDSYAESRIIVQNCIEWIDGVEKILQKEGVKIEENE